LKKKLAEAKEENARLKENLAKQNEEILILGQHSSVIEYEASEASMARDRTEAKLTKLSKEFKSLQVEHVELQEDHSILNKDLRQLEEKHSETLEQLKES
jgi:predicted  nucleic acid-binding Zn-ribbon protein